MNLILLVASLVAYAGSCVSASALKPRANQATPTTFKLYAYGPNITNGLRFFYGDGQAYIGSSAPPSVTQAVNITLTSTDSDTTFLVNADSATTNWTSQPMMYIDTTTNAFEPVGFTTSNTTLSEGEVTEGFGLYGGWAFHLNDAGTVDMNFYASPTEENDVYLVKWNAASTKATDGISIALRTEAPMVIT
ncbi:hypothetical protein AOQ84DRAFT_440255 [Glonium stellatum]|uniref:Uncharacterized protein n=1 Tax=Glonium stellatum TaxID=574774 RepID=A0A8E2EZR6_9PEZI|nr:hypothetical protein AOQ84DRAFT_440255 [Glonium stellatum]